MSEFITMGEPLIVFCSTELDKSLVDATNFNKVAGGAELNVAVGVSRLGHSVDFISQLGADPHGDYIIKQLRRHGVGTRYVKQTSAYLTGYQMKQLVSKGDPFVFNFRKNSAATHIDPTFIDSISLKSVKICHLTGILPAISASASKASHEMIKRLKAKNILITFDPNLRPAMWPNQTTMVREINQLASYANIVLPGIDEGRILTGSSEPEFIADFYLKNKATKAVFVKVGAKGVFVKSKSGLSQYVSGFKAEHVVDTVGAGDGFALGVITALLEAKDYLQAAKRGNAVGCLQVQTHGDNDGYPTKDQLADFYIKEAN